MFRRWAQTWIGDDNVIEGSVHVGRSVKIGNGNVVGHSTLVSTCRPAWAFNFGEHILPGLGQRTKRLPSTKDIVNLLPQVCCRKTHSVSIRVHLL
jgi:hypothetical protein